MFKNTTIRFTDENSVEVILDDNGKKVIKDISLKTFVSALNSSVKRQTLNEEIKMSKIYPVFDHIHTVQYVDMSNGKEMIVLMRDEKPIDISYEETIFENVGLPKLIFVIIFFKGILQSVYIAGVKAKIVTKSTDIYYYPFAHVGSPGSQACLGGNRFGEKDFVIKDIYQAYKMPDMFLSMPNGNDYYNNVNNSGLEMRPLLERLSKNSFPSEWLRKYELNYSQWIDKLLDPR